MLCIVLLLMHIGNIEQSRVVTFFRMGVSVRA